MIRRKHRHGKKIDFTAMVSIATSPIDLNHYHEYLPQERQLRMKREKR
jgi:hypothetical protein